MAEPIFYDRLDTITDENGELTVTNNVYRQFSKTGFTIGANTLVQSVTNDGGTLGSLDTVTGIFSFTKKGSYLISVGHDTSASGLNANIDIELLTGASSVIEATRLTYDKNTTSHRVYNCINRVFNNTDTFRLRLNISGLSVSGSVRVLITKIFNLP